MMTIESTNNTTRMIVTVEVVVEWLQKCDSSYGNGYIVSEEEAIHSVVPETAEVR